MKANKIKPQRKITKKVVKKNIEKSLTDKFLTAVKDLGHNAEVIAEDIANLSKLAAKKLAKKFKDVKIAVEHQIEEVKPSAQKVKLDKKNTSKLLKKVDKSVAKVVKKAVNKTKPVASSVKVKEINSEENVAAAINSSKRKKDMEPSNPTVKKSTEKSAKKAVVKAVTNNPVEKVSTTAIPEQPKIKGKKAQK